MHGIVSISFFGPVIKSPGRKELIVNQVVIYRSAEIIKKVAAHTASNEQNHLLLARKPYIS